MKLHFVIALCLALALPSSLALAEKEVQSVPVPMQVVPAAPSPVKPKDNTCQTDDDCSTVMISCNSCCPSYAADENAAVNKEHAKDYENPGICTAEHIRNCGVPECGLMPTPYPAASCTDGVCTLYMHEPEQRAP